GRSQTERAGARRSSPPRVPDTAREVDMDPHSHPPAAPATGGYSAPTNGIAVASVSLGFFSNVVFWWYPFSLLLACTGLTLGLISLSIGLKGGRRGENLALAGTGLCAVSLTVTFILGTVLRYVDWDNFLR